MPSPLLAPFRLGDLELTNRVVMAPLTRNRATPGTDAPSELDARYYRQRAGAGLIVTEGSQISQRRARATLDPGRLHRGAGRGLAQGDRRSA